MHRWALEDLQRIHTAEELAADEGGGVEMHVLEDAGHWVFWHPPFLLLFFFTIKLQTKRFDYLHVSFQVHADNPDGLFRILSSTFRIETTIRGMQD